MGVLTVAAKSLARQARRKKNAFLSGLKVFDESPMQVFGRLWAKSKGDERKTFLKFGEIYNNKIIIDAVKKEQVESGRLPSSTYFLDTVYKEMDAMQMRYNLGRGVSAGTAGAGAYGVSERLRNK